MKYLERQIYGPCYKLEGCIWNSHSQFGTKKTMKSFVKFPWISLPNINYSKEFGEKRKFCKASTKSLLYISNIYLVIFHLIIHTHSFFINTKLLMFHSGIMADVGAFAKLWKTSISFCHVSPHGTSRIEGVLSLNLTFKYLSKFCLDYSSSFKLAQKYRSFTWR